MNRSSRPPSATSLPRAPRDDSGARSARYLAMMGVRVLCFVLMVLITPYGWYTWVFALGAVFLPYVAVVFANVGATDRVARSENPERQIATPVDSAPPPAPADRVLRIQESAPPPRRGEGE
ncbi:DUF3099 family protein [Microbacterium sp. SLBN-154]|nr:DUF3099 family protein [Microbacterium sp. SLBN-154]